MKPMESKNVVSDFSVEWFYKFFLSLLFLKLLNWEFIFLVLNKWSSEKLPSVQPQKLHNRDNHFWTI